MQTVRHFFPALPLWLRRLPDSRLQEACIDSTPFLAWWGLCLYLLQLGARRQLDYELRDARPQVLANLNRLGQAEQTTLPVHDTLDHFLGHVPLSGWEELRTRMVQRLLRMKALDAARLLGQPVLLIDATGLSWTTKTAKAGVGRCTAWTARKPTRCRGKVSTSPG